MYPRAASCRTQCAVLTVLSPHYCLPMLCVVWIFFALLSFRSGADEVVLSGCTLELPPAEYDHLARLTDTGSGQVVLKLSSEFV
jgi:hypothetical protein